MNTSVPKRLKVAFRSVTILRSRDLARYGINRGQIAEAVQAGLLERAGRGLYHLPSPDVTLHHSLAQISILVPDGVICLLSALNFHDFTTQNPYQVWITIGHKAWHPRPDAVGLRVFRLSSAAFHTGIENHVIEGVPVKVYSPAKTVADCFKFRHKIGLDVAVEALREGWRYRKFTLEQLAKMAEVCRVRRVIQPYLEMLT